MGVEQETLQAGRQRFYTAFQTSEDAVCLCRLETAEVVDCNESFSRFTGFDCKELVGRRMPDLPIWYKHDICDRILHELAKKRSVMDLEVAFQDKFGQPLLGKLSAMQMQHQSTPHLLLVIRDLDALKKTREALASSEARFRELFDNMSNGVMVLKPSENGEVFLVVNFNRAAERIEGKKRNDLIGRNIIEALPSTVTPGLQSIYKRVWKSGIPEHYPVTIYRDDRLGMWKEHYIYKLPSGEIVNVYDDITERKLAEEKLLLYQQQLKALASELSLAEDRERRILAAELHDQIGQTLSLVKMKLHNLRGHLADEEIRQEFDETRSFLDQAIRDTRSLTLELSPPILYELGLEAALEWLAEGFRKKTGISCQVRAECGTNLNDDINGVLFRSVREILFNVYKHAEARLVKVSTSPKRGCFQVRVKDNGIGFDIAAVEKRVTGHAYGLFSIRERLSHLGGKMQVDSKLGKGTTVTLEVPLPSGKNTVEVFE
ncbi:MAG: PAS domain S-box protein [Proteobacteria bacterium]|nr:PAS domain S-box protein [Pseudomonadota bacterium]MBU1739475.1 PAS domain S-box protein [Pseudomonadota bacterium]